MDRKRGRRSWSWLTQSCLGQPENCQISREKGVQSQRKNNRKSKSQMSVMIGQSTSYLRCFSLKEELVHLFWFLTITLIFICDCFKNKTLWLSWWVPAISDILFWPWPTNFFGHRYTTLRYLCSHFLFLLMQNEQDVWDNILGVVCNGIEEKNGSRGPSLLVFKAELLIDILCIRFSKVFLGSFWGFKA